MNLQRLVVTAFLCFVSVATTSVNSVGARVVPIDNEEADSLRQIPYTINTTEVQGATTIWADLFGSDTALQGNPTGKYLLPEPLTTNHPIEFVSISVPNGRMMGQDVLIWQEKEGVIFNAENTAITEALSVLIGFRATEQQLVQAYPLIRVLPRIPELKQIMLAEQGYPTSDSLLDQNAELSVEIAAEVMQAIRFPRR